jgi:glycogen debranching enzyme
LRHISSCTKPALGAEIGQDGLTFRVWSHSARQIWVSIFDAADEELARLPLERGEGDIHHARVPGLGPGTRYGFRADGPYNPAHGHWFDPAKLLTDPYAVAIDRPFAYDPRLAARRGDGPDTAPLMPKSVAIPLPEPLPAAPPLFRPGGLIYELPVRAFTMLHPEIPEAQRGTVAALAHPAVIEHLVRLRVAAVELLPVTAWIDERHLPPLGLTNVWGYNPVTFMAPDPRICPGGIPELREAVQALREAGIGTILDVVFNHTGEADADGPTLSLRGLDNRAYFRHEPHGALVNDTGCGNTLACDREPVRRLVLDSLRRFVTHAEVDGFRFDLATILGRGEDGFDPDAPLLAEIAADPVLGDRVLIAEPWDIGFGGYRLGEFPDAYLEWNDRYRDSIRRFWRGDPGTLAGFATALAGSSDVFAPPWTRAVNYIASHDGFTLADLTAYSEKHNHANGEGNRDGHGDNHSWNHGVEGPSEDKGLRAARDRDRRALLATLFASRGAIMLTAGDEFGHSQQGNNNAYAQDNETTWRDWQGRDRALEAHVAALAELRAAHPGLADPGLLTGETDGCGIPDVTWLSPHGRAMTPAEWEHADAGAIAMVLREGGGDRIAVLFNRRTEPVAFRLEALPGRAWDGAGPDGHLRLPPRSVSIIEERLGGS